MALMKMMVMTTALMKMMVMMTRRCKDDGDDDDSYDNEDNDDDNGCKSVRFNGSPTVFHSLIENSHKQPMKIQLL